MSNKANKNRELLGPASFKQSWKIAHMFAHQLKDKYPQYDHSKLTRLINGAIYYYHQSIGTEMSKAEASDIISNNLTCPKYYIDHLDDFLENPKVFTQKNPSESHSSDLNVPDVELLNEIANFPRGTND